ncbi:hypothetical protein OG298_02125 [Streptomyces sp. NBC_01005]|uniref:hypothetical protein n=1 Tax=Streptomyces sp. NBC_01005 TaxID=2903715 RepID=UPI0038704F4F|nr:hypothetical protein OG298_02125 [Streptomyces sp. NBC_01005]
MSELGLLDYGGVTVSDAVYGLLGALGGAIVAATATFYGPLQLQKRALRESSAERDSTHAHAHAHAEANRQSELQRAQVARVVQVRKAMAAWDSLLARTFRLLGNGIVDPGAFHQAAERARVDASTALYEALNDGLYIPATQGSDGRERLEFGDYPDLRDDPADSKWVLDKFEKATEALNAMMESNVDTSSDAWVELWVDTKRHVLSAHRCRTDLSHALMRHVETIADVTTIETHGGDRTGLA